MSQSEYSKIMKSIIATVAAALFISLGSVFSNYVITKYKVGQTEIRVDKMESKLESKAEKTYVDNRYKEAQSVAVEKEKRFDEMIISLKDNFVDLKNEQKEANDLMLKYMSNTNKQLWEINNKIKD